MRHYQREAREDLGYAFLIFSDADDQLVGGLTLSNVRRGVTQAAVVGYWLGKPFVCRGYMTEAVRAAVGFGFESLHLHRLEAATMPNNASSIRVLERNGFGQFGHSRRSFELGGQWFDRLLFERHRDEPAPG